MVCVPVRYTRAALTAPATLVATTSAGSGARSFAARASAAAAARVSCAWESSPASWVCAEGRGGGRHGAILGRGDAKGKSRRSGRATHRLHGGPRQASPSEREAETRARAVVRALGGARDEIRAVFEDAHRRVAVSAAPRLSRVAHHIRAQSLGIAPARGRGRRSRPRPSRARGARDEPRGSSRGARRTPSRTSRARGVKNAGWRGADASVRYYLRRSYFQDGSTFSDLRTLASLVPSRPSTASSSLSSPPRGPYPPARYTFIHADLRRHRGHLSILAAHASQHHEVSAHSR